ncbi:hypothetical protein [Streptomyces venezuelae]|uniref:hypothetical protein n=1 Tax=Streptomyces venezuelae TaxID=54571 RepID=UPI00168225BF|nr:hypothetical protein [Streptomyces venezuelae]
MSHLISRNAIRSLILAGVLALATGFAVQVEEVEPRTQEVQVLADGPVNYGATPTDHGWQ